MFLEASARSRVLRRMLLDEDRGTRRAVVEIPFTVVQRDSRGVAAAAPPWISMPRPVLALFRLWPRTWVRTCFLSGCGET